MEKALNAVLDRSSSHSSLSSTTISMDNNSIASNSFSSPVSVASENSQSSFIENGRPNPLRYDGLSAESIREAKELLLGGSGLPIFPRRKKLRFMGTFMTTMHSLVKGTNVLRHGDQFVLKRSAGEASLAAKKRKRSAGIAAKANIVVRAWKINSNDKNSLSEIAKLATEDAVHICRLLDLGLCEFLGTIVYVPSNLNMLNDIVVDVSVFLTQNAFAHEEGYSGPIKIKKDGGIVALETDDAAERELKSRKVII